MSSQPSLPAWLVAVVIIEMLPMFAFPIIVLSNPAAAPLLTGGELSFAGVIYSARNLAVGIALLFALILRHRAMLFILILVRLITDLIDYPAFLLLADVSNTLAVSAIFLFVFYIPAAFALRYLWKDIRTG